MYSLALRETAVNAAFIESVSDCQRKNCNTFIGSKSWNETCRSRTAITSFLPMVENYYNNENNNGDMFERWLSY